MHYLIRCIFLVASTATTEEKMNFHKAVLKNLQKAAVQKGLMPGVVGPPLFVEEQATPGVVPTTGVGAGVQPQPPGDHCLPHHPYPGGTQVKNFNYFKDARYNFNTIFKLICKVIFLSVFL